jgi:hypothetical protein
MWNVKNRMLMLTSLAYETLYTKKRDLMGKLNEVEFSQLFSWETSK